MILLKWILIGLVASLIAALIIALVDLDSLGGTSGPVPPFVWLATTAIGYWRDPRRT